MVRGARPHELQAGEGGSEGLDHMNSKLGRGGVRGARPHELQAGEGGSEGLDHMNSKLGRGGRGDRGRIKREHVPFWTEDFVIKRLPF